jgi:hypothetical protein
MKLESIGHGLLGMEDNENPLIPCIGSKDTCGSGGCLLRYRAYGYADRIRPMMQAGGA